MALTLDEEQWLAPYFFDSVLQEQLAVEFRAGRLSADTNRIRGRIRLPDDGTIGDLPSPTSARGLEAVAAGANIASRGELALLVLNGGMATRFGGGAKGVVPVDHGVSFLGLKIIGARLLSERYGAGVPVYLMNSMATHAATLAHLEEYAYFGHDPSLVRPFLQNTLLRLTPEGGLFRHADGRLSPYGPGHGDIIEAVVRSVRADMESRGTQVVQVSNVDNALATPDPLLVGVHVLSGVEMTVEVVPNTGADTGGGPLVVGGRLQIVEGFRLPGSFDMSSLSDFNANTFCLAPSCFDRTYPLSWFVVHKTVDHCDAIQLERLAGQLSAFVPTAYCRVPRGGAGCRFSPIKDRETLQAEKGRIISTLRTRGFLPEYRP
ncbi:MAG: UTP--glucose-1-phosphate uridylyltransferase [Candidatus Eisenbacteria bacterium]|nr:UTP--glucose-1-phosphate uridylyltransferase [Candidatus Eisenbacteria bacterium]